MQNLDIVMWYFSSWQQIMLILVFPAKLPTQNDVFEATDHKYQSVKLKIMVFICPKESYKQKKHIKINEKILWETWSSWGTTSVPKNAWPYK